MTKPHKRRNAIDAFRTSPMRKGWESWMAGVFNVPADWTPPPTVTMSLARKTRIATYKARFTCPNGTQAESVVRLKLLPAGGATVVSSEIRQRFTAKAKLKGAARPAWDYTQAQLVADLRHACQAYRVDRFEARSEVARLTTLVAGLQEGIAAAMVVLSEDLEAGEPVMFARGVTMWEHLALLRDPTGELPPPKGMFPATTSMGQAYAALPRDPATGRPVIA